MLLKEYLKSNNISKEDFALNMGVSYASVSSWTYGDRFPRPLALKKIYEHTNGQVTANDFVQQISK